MPCFFGTNRVIRCTLASIFRERCSSLFQNWCETEGFEPCRRYFYTASTLCTPWTIGCSPLSHQSESCSSISNVISGWSHDLCRKIENTTSIGHRESLKCKTCLYRGILGGQLADTRYRSVTRSSRSPSDVRIREQKSRNARTLNCYVEKLVNVEKLLLANRNSTVHSMYMKRSGWLSFPAFCRISPAACAF